MMEAPVTAIIAYDLDFWKELPFLFPHEDRRPLFENKPEYVADTAYRNGTLQGAYFMIAARAVGLDVGAMSGFSNKIVDEEFFAGTTLKSNFLCNLGYADETGLFQKLPRFPFEKVCCGHESETCRDLPNDSSMPDTCAYRDPNSRS